VADRWHAVEPVFQTGGITRGNDGTLKSGRIDWHSGRISRRLRPVGIKRRQPACAAQDVKVRISLETSRILFVFWNPMGSEPYYKTIRREDWAGNPLKI
jgi:hypothetical protein